MASSKGFDPAAYEVSQRVEAYRALIALTKAAEVAHAKLGGWGDAVRALAEQRLGIGSEDSAAWGDPAYGRSLDLYSHLRETGKCVAAEVALFREVLGLLPDARPCPGCDQRGRDIQQQANGDLVCHRCGRMVAPTPPEDRP